jgi:tight adherence protein B
VYILIFIVLLLITFAVVLFFTRPTRVEKSVSSRLEGISESPAAPTAPDEDILKREALSEVPWLDLILNRLAIAASLQKLIAQADSQWTVGRLVVGSILILIGVPWLGHFWIDNTLVLLLLGLILASAPYVYLRIKRAARFNKFTSLLPDAIDLMARAMKAGHSIASAIEMIAAEVGPPVGPEFRRLFEEQNFGLPLREALSNLIERVPIQDLRFLVTAILVQRETGGNLIEVLEKTGVVLRERMRLLGQLRIYTAQGKMTGVILCVLPFVVFAVISFLNPRYAHILTEDPFGQKMIAAGLILMIFGVFVIRRIIDIKV